jgi:alkylated DNA repair dioxygenase AlkB
LILSFSGLTRFPIFPKAGIAASPYVIRIISNIDQRYSWHILYRILFMDTLFPLEPLLPPGFKYIPRFLSPQEEKELLETLAAIEVVPMNFHGYTAKRNVASFGAGWSFSNQALVKGEDIPKEFDPLLEKISLQFSVSKNEMAQLLVTEYPVGSVINWHRDAPPYDFIIGVSLLTDCLFRFRPYDTKKQSRGAILSLPVERRSVYLIKGEARREWEHSIAPVKQKRYSITVRVLR